MTVYSINKRVLEQANMTQAAERVVVSPFDSGFASVLQNASTRFSGLGEPSAAAALAERFNRQAAEAREPEKVEKPQRNERKGDKGQAKRADKPADKAERADSPEAPRNDRQNVAEAKPEERVDETAAAAGSGDQTDSPADGQTQAQTADGAQTQAVAAPVENGQQKQVAVGQLAETMIEAEGGEVADDALAGMRTGQQSNNAGQKAQAEAGLVTDEADPALELAVETAAAAGPAKAKTQADQGAVETAGAEDLADAQAEDMAEMLAGTGARVQMKVEVTEAAEQAVTAGDDVAMAELALAQDGAELGGQASGNNGGATQAKGQGIANAAGQVAQNPALDNALAAQGKAVDAKPFAAVLAAQVDGAQQPSSVQSGQSQTNAGMASVGGTQAAQKAQAAQAPQAPQAPRHVPPQQVIDQVSVQIDKQVKEGADSIKIQLKPHDLGKIEIKLEVGQDGRVTGVVTADNKDTLAILQKDAKGLEKALQDAGLKTESGALSFNLRGEHQQNAESNGAEGQSGRRRGRVKTGIDATGEAQAAASQNQARGLGRRSGVDIQV